MASYSEMSRYAGEFVNLKEEELRQIVALAVGQLADRFGPQRTAEVLKVVGRAVVRLCDQQDRVLTPRQRIMEEIIGPILLAHGVIWDEVLGKNRRRRYVEARQEIAWALRRNTDWSFPEIGRFMGRDHSTIMHSCRAVQRRLDTASAAA